MQNGRGRPQPTDMVFGSAGMGSQPSNLLSSVHITGLAPVWSPWCLSEGTRSAACMHTGQHTARPLHLLASSLRLHAIATCMQEACPAHTLLLRPSRAALWGITPAGSGAFWDKSTALRVRFQRVLQGSPELHRQPCESACAPGAPHIWPPSQPPSSSAPPPLPPAPAPNAATVSSCPGPRQPGQLPGSSNAFIGLQIQSAANASAGACSAKTAESQKGRHTCRLLVFWISVTAASARICLCDSWRTSEWEGFLRGLLCTHVSFVPDAGASYQDGRNSSCRLEECSCMLVNAWQAGLVQRRPPAHPCW